MAVDVPRDLRRCAVAVAVAVMCLASIWSVGAEPGGVRPTEHGLVYAKEPGPTSPAMAAFFRPGPVVELPEAKQVPEPTWSLVPPGPQRTEAAGNTRRTAAIVAVGVLCGSVGLALIAAASMAYVIYVRRSSDSARGAGSAPGLGLIPKGCREIRLGAV